MAVTAAPGGERLPTVGAGSTTTVSPGGATPLSPGQLHWRLGKSNCSATARKLRFDAVDGHGDRRRVAGEPDDLGGVPERVGGGRIAPGVHRVGEPLELAGQAGSIAVARRSGTRVAAAERAQQSRTQHPGRASPS